MDPFLGEIRPVPYNFAPRGWAFCNGQILSIAQNTALFSLLGTTYGGNGQTTFALPDLRSRIPVGAGTAPFGGTYDLGEQDGVETVTLTDATNPSHIHGLTVSNSAADVASPAAALPGISVKNAYIPTATGTFAPGAVTPAGGSQPHDNIMPYLAISYIIALEGIFPSRN